MDYRGVSLKIVAIVSPQESAAPISTSTVININSYHYPHTDNFNYCDKLCVVGKQLSNDCTNYNDI